MIKDHGLLIIVLIIHYSIGVPTCQRVVTYEEIQQLLVDSPCAVDVNRIKRASDTGSSNHIYALKSTVNDHRTIIDDHRTMINYLMNNTVNITQLDQHFAEQHMKRRPIWTSWRDISLLFLVFIVMSLLIYFLVITLKPLEILTRFFVRRHQMKQCQSTMKNEKKNQSKIPHNSSTVELNMRY